jgi:hypothetical protein
MQTIIPATNVTPVLATPETVVAYKGFDRNLQCRGFQDEVGKTYRFNGEISCCQNGGHSVEMPMDAFSYYPPTISRYGET